MSRKVAGNYLLEVRHVAPRRLVESVRPEMRRIEDRLCAGDQVGDQVAGAWTDAEAVPRKPRGQNESGHLRYCSDTRNAVGRAVDVTRPGTGDGGLPKCRQQVDGT